MTRPNGIATNYSYDKLSHLLSVLHQAGSSTIDGASYTLDAAGNRTARTDYLAGVTSNYTYDKIYELTQVTQGTNTTESYSYDPVGNRLSSLGVASYSYNSSNELTSNSNGSYSYDNNGNTTSETNSGGTTSYTWDFENRLTQVTLPNSGGTVSFKYDPFGRRIQKLYTTGATPPTTTTTNYLYDGDNEVEQVDQNGNVLSRFAQGQNIDEPLALSASGTTSFYEQDGLGSVTSLTSGTGAVAQSYTFDSFGKVVNSSGNIANPFRYTGRDFDSESGLYYYRARYYDSSTGRFLSEDPISFGGGVNFYQYARSSPINYFDPSGLDVEALCEPVQQYHLGFIFGAVHCRLHKKYDGLNETLELPGAGRVDDEQFDPARPGYPLPVKRPQNADECHNFERCIDKQYDFYKNNPQDLPRYNAVNSNSNAFILSLVRSCGGDIPYNEFHYVSPFNWYHFYGQMPTN